MRRLIELDLKLEDKIQHIIKSKGYRDFQHFAIISLENQSLLELENCNNNIINEKHQSKPESIVQKDIPTTLLRLHLKSLLSPKLLEMPNDNFLLGKLLWGQYYRFLPVKLAVRVLSNLTTNDYVPLNTFLNDAINTAFSIRKILKKIDTKERRQFGEKLSAAFPDDTDKSIRRFKHHFLLYVRKNDSILDGMLPRLKFANVKIKDGEEFVGLTSAGKKFADLFNPVLDENKSPAFSELEVEFLLDHISDNIPNEADHIFAILKIIDSGNNSRNSVNSALRNYYNQYFDGHNWSDEVVNTMRAGLFGRLSEINLIVRQKNGKELIYTITDRGRKFIEGFQFDHKIQINNHSNDEISEFTCIRCGLHHIESNDCKM